MYSKIVPNGTPQTANKKLFSNSKMIPIICENVLIFPGHAAAKTWPSFSTMINRNPVTASSRQTIIATTQAGALPISTSNTNAVMTIILSANGSANLPKLVTRWLRRAIWPSKKSVIEATANTKAATICVTGIDVWSHVTVPQSIGTAKMIRKTGIKIIRIIVSLLGKFNLFPPNHGVRLSTNHSRRKSERSGWSLHDHPDLPNYGRNCRLAIIAYATLLIT